MTHNLHSVTLSHESDGSAGQTQHNSSQLCCIKERGDLVELEKVQRKTAEVKRMEQLPHKERQKRLKLHCSLEKRQLSRDMTEICLFTKVVGQRTKLSMHPSIL